MPLTSHLSALEQKHQALEKEIQAELGRPLADESRLQVLKRQKLKLKEQIAKLRIAPAGETLH